MNTIIPRWEWRTFGTASGRPTPAFAALETEKVQESDEVYLLSPVDDANVKIRAEPDGPQDARRSRRRPASSNGGRS